MYVMKTGRGSYLGGFAAALLAACAACFACAAEEPQTAGFSFAADGIITPRGRILWDDVLKARLYERPTQKLIDVDVRAKVGVWTERRVHLDCTESLGCSYVPVRLDLDGTYLRVSIESGDIVEPLGCSYRVMELSVLPGLLDARAEEPGRYLLPIFGGGRRGGASAADCEDTRLRLCGHPA